MNHFNKSLYYILNIIWGFPMTFIGLIAAVTLLIMGHCPTRYGGCFYFQVGHNWGGINLGLVFLTDTTFSASTCNHEYGHSLQNAILGPLMPFLVGLPSAARYWYRELRYYRRNKRPPTDYDDIWFEGTATKWGNNTIKFWEKI